MAVIRPTGHLSHYGFSPEETEDYLAHYGVKGMKWGKRLKNRVSTFVDEKITGKSAQTEADRYRADAERYSKMAEKHRANYQSYGNDAKSAINKSMVLDKIAQVSYAKANQSMAAKKEANSKAAKYEKEAASATRNKKKQRIASDTANSYREEAQRYLNDTRGYIAAAGNARASAKSQREAHQRNLAVSRQQMNAMRTNERNRHQAQAKAASAQRRADQSLFGKARVIFGKPKGPTAKKKNRRFGG